VHMKKRIKRKPVEAEQEAKPVAERMSGRR
jgi:hypothetical protein